MEVDRRAFLATLGVGTVGMMSPEDRAEALEHYMMDKLDEPAKTPIIVGEQEQDGPQPPRGVGNLFRPTDRVLEPMPDKPTLEDFFRLRFAPANHVLQSAAHALKTDQPEQTVRAYKRLSVVERAFRSFKTVDLKVRPIHHRLADRVRAHVFLCMLAYYVEWHMREALAPILFDDDDKGEAENLRKSVVAPAQRSERAKRKASSKRTDDDQPVHSFRTLLKDLATITKNHVRFIHAEAQTMEMMTTPTPFQHRVFELLKVPLKM